MKLEGDRHLKISQFVYKCLLAFIFLLGVIFLLGTVYGVFFHVDSPNRGEEENFKKGEQKIGGQTFTGIGQLRILTADPQPGTIILFVSFIYYPEDKAFSEELVLKIRDFRDIIIYYFRSLSVDELQKLDDGIIKAELLQRFNKILRLGRIDTLYFSDFMIIR